MKTLTKKNSEEIIAAIPELNDEQKAELLDLEGQRDNPRDDVLSALGVDPETNLKNDPDIDEDELKKAQALVEKAKARKIHPHDILDTRKQFSMIHFEGTKQYIQDGKIFDRATKKLICTVEDAEKRKAEKAKKAKKSDD